MVPGHRASAVWASRTFWPTWTGVEPRQRAPAGSLLHPLSTPEAVLDGCVREVVRHSDWSGRLVDLRAVKDGATLTAAGMPTRAGSHRSASRLAERAGTVGYGAGTSGRGWGREVTLAARGAGGHRDQRLTLGTGNRQRGLYRRHRLPPLSWPSGAGRLLRREAASPKARRRSPDLLAAIGCCAEVLHTWRCLSPVSAGRRGTWAWMCSPLIEGRQADWCRVQPSSTRDQRWLHYGDAG